MLALNMLINNFRIISIVAQYRAGHQDGAVILGMRESDDELVVAEVGQHLIDADEPATSWGQGHYFPASPNAAVKAGALFAERSSLAAMTKTIEHWEAAERARIAREAEEAEAKAVLEKVRAAAEGQKYQLVQTAWDEGLNPKQVTVLLRGENEWQSDEFDRISEMEGEQRHEGAVYEIKNILDDEEFETLESGDLLDEAIHVIQDRDESDIIDSLLRSTRSLLVRYDLGVAVDIDHTSSDEDRHDQALAIAAGLGVDAPGKDLLDAIIAILVESGDGQAYMFWYADPEDLVKAARPFQQARFTEEYPAPAATISFERVELLVLNKFSGSGYSAAIPGRFTIPFDALRLTTDAGDDSGYSWDDVAGLVPSAFAGKVTITPAT